MFVETGEGRKQVMIVVSQMTKTGRSATSANLIRKTEVTRRGSTTQRVEGEVSAAREGGNKGSKGRKS